MMKNFTISIFFVLFSLTAWAQTGQVTINRVSQMPNLPAPYEMRDWKDVAVKYDQLIYYKTTGQYFPLIGLQSNGVNYPSLSPITLKTFVGIGMSAEAINIIPSVVGASLMNIDKSNQAGTNWVLKTKEFFNRNNDQDVYLNNYVTTSGTDWWYDVMPNIFFYQLYSLYPATTDFNTQFTTVADRWLEAVHAMGGSTAPWAVPNMNYRAFNLATMTGLASGVREPEAAGGIGWLLYHAYLETGEKKYLDGAQMSLEFLSGLTSNPSYELQLPYGAFIAAKMNAEQGNSYDVPKILNWCFDRGPLRGWGVIKGQWDGKDVSGLIGEANDGGNDYAFALNGFQQAAALVPLIKYDKRFTRDISKWALNVANASRFFYRPFPTTQDDLAWSTANDPDAVIAYEALKERDSHNSNRPLNATGDAKRSGWAETNLGLYGSSSVGYLAAVIETTDVSGILALNLNKTDFFLDETYPMRAVYNPHGETKLVTLTLPAGSHNIYNAITEEVILTSVSATAQVSIPAGEAALLVYIPAGSTPVESDGKLIVNNRIIDYNYGYDFTPDLRIKSIATSTTTVQFGDQAVIHLTVDNAGAGATYSWSDNSGSLGVFTTPAFTWTAPAVEGENVLTVSVTFNSKTVTDSIEFNVVEDIPAAPVITAISSASPWQPMGASVVFTCEATDDDQLPAQLQYEWTVSAGTLSAQTGNQITWQAPAAQGINTITCKVKDNENLTTELSRKLLVKQASVGTSQPFAYYPLDGNANDYAGNHDGELAGVAAVADARGESGKAFLFDSNADIVSIPGSTDFNFTEAITVSFWVKANSIPEECFIISHGSWEERWKISLTPTHYVRWTVKTNAGVFDLDSSFPVELNKFYHFTAVYTGFSLELYVDGVLNSFMLGSASIALTGKSMTFGRKAVGEPNHYLRGVLDEVRIYDKVLAPNEIETLKDLWNTFVTGTENNLEQVSVYPNPTDGPLYVRGISADKIQKLEIFDMSGKSIPFETFSQPDGIGISMSGQKTGMAILKLQSGKNILHRKIVLR